jgi:hypothetical protein
MRAWTGTMTPAVRRNVKVLQIASVMSYRFVTLVIRAVRDNDALPEQALGLT